MMNVAELSDTQLYSLSRKKRLKGELGDVVRKELALRNFSIDYVDKLAMEYEERTLQSNKAGLSATEKIFIILFPFFIPLQIIVASRHLWNGNMRRWQQHWRYVTIGFAIWTILILFYSRYYLFN